MKNLISMNLKNLRKTRGYTQEEVAELIGVSRQTIAKWESGETMPDMDSCLAVAKLYNTTLDSLVYASEKQHDEPTPPKGKHIFGVVRLGERGQIVIPREARRIFNISVGDSLLVLGDEAQGIAIVKNEHLVQFAQGVLEAQEHKEDT